MQFGAILYEALPAFPYDPAIWGRQLVVDEEDHVLDEVEKLLTGAVRLTLAEAAALCRRMGGVPVPAHADADSYSVFSVLGGWPMDVHVPGGARDLANVGSRVYNFEGHYSIPYRCYYSRNGST